MPSLRNLPSVDRMLADPRLAAEPHALVVEAARAALDRARDAIRAGRDPGDPVEACLAELAAARRPSLRRVLNATGVIVHTNLGRAPLAAAALERVAEVGGGYSNLEYDLERGARGSRQDHLAALVRRLTGAEAALVVNNNAAAVLLALAALAEGREVIVSRGELVEIGDGFRIPDVLARSGATPRRGRHHEPDARRRLRAGDRPRHRRAPARAPVQLPRRRLHRAAAARRPRLAGAPPRSSARRRPGLRRPRRRRRRADRRGEPGRRLRPRLLLRRQAARRAAGRHRGRPRRPRRAAAPASAAARAAGRQAHAGGARGNARARARPGARTTRDPRAADARRAAGGGAVTRRASRRARGRRGGGDGRPGRRRRAAAPRAAVVRLRDRGGPVRAAPPRRAAGRRDRPRRAAAARRARARATTRSTRSPPPSWPPARIARDGADGRHGRAHRPRQDVARAGADREGHGPAAGGATARHLDRPRLRAARAAGRPAALPRRRAGARALRAHDGGRCDRHRPVPARDRRGGGRRGRRRSSICRSCGCSAWSTASSP